MPWTPPAKLPPPNDLTAALKTLEDRSRGVSETVLAGCFAKLVAIFEPGSKLNARETEMRLAAWRDACGDIPGDLWQVATEVCCASLKWMPKPVELREAVADRLERRRKAITRIKLMIEADPAKQFEAEPWPVRVKAMRDSWKKIGKTEKAAHYERELAEIEGREVEDWARAAAPPVEAKPERPPFKPSDSPSARRCAELAANSKHRGKLT